MNQKNDHIKTIIANNKKAHYNYFIESEFEAGIVLKGSEVKSLKKNECSIQDSYAHYNNNTIVLLNFYIKQYKQASVFNHKVYRPKKLLLHKKEIRKIIGKIKIKSYTVVVLTVFINNKNIIKVKIGIAKGKKLYDKRENIKLKNWKRFQEREIKKSLKTI